MHPTEGTPQTGRLSPARALAGAALSVGGVLLGIASLLWVTDDPSQGPGPTVQSGPAPLTPAPLVREGPLQAEVPSDPSPPAAGGAVAPSPVEPAPVEPAPGNPAAGAPAPGEPVRSAPVPPARTQPVGAGPGPAASGAGRPTSRVVPVTVLNNSHRTGLADRAAVRFERGGWPVSLTGNFRGQIPVTTVYYDPGLEASARAFAAAFDGIVRVRPRFATLPARGVVVVLTREFAA